MHFSCRGGDVIDWKKYRRKGMADIKKYEEYYSNESFMDKVSRCAAMAGREIADRRFCLCRCSNRDARPKKNRRTPAPKSPPVNGEADAIRLQRWMGTPTAKSGKPVNPRNGWASVCSVRWLSPSFRFEFFCLLTGSTYRLLRDRSAVRFPRRKTKHWCFYRCAKARRQ